jgi:hypothetical protein
MIAQPYASAAFAQPKQRRAVTRGEQTFRGSVRDAGERRPFSDGDDAIGAELLRELGLRDVGVLLVGQENLRAKLPLIVVLSAGTITWRAFKGHSPTLPLIINFCSLGWDDNVAGLRPCKRYGKWLLITCRAAS